MARVGLIKKQITDKRGKRTTVWVRPHGDLGILRIDMPQVSHGHVEDFLRFVHKNNVKTHKRSTKVKELTSTQHEINQEKVDSMIKRAKDEGNKFLKKRIMVSSDGHILDGHHRWASLTQIDPNSKIKTVTIDLPIRKLLALANKYPKVERRSISQFTSAK